MPGSRTKRIELLERRIEILRARASLTDWARTAGFEPAQHHLVMIEALTDLVKGSGPGKVMLFLPPGSAKSTYGSQIFPPWFLAQDPTQSIIAASHTLELAERWGRRCRNLIADHERELGIAIAEGNGAAGRWQLAPRPGTDDDGLFMGEYLAAGVDKAIAGFRADLGLIDDPVKGREAAASETQRAKVWDWYVYDFRTRLKPGAKQVLIQTRWHEEDLAGKILAEEGDEWRVISIPMIAEDVDDPLGRAIGERLWPEWFTDKMVAVAQRDAALWNSLYQQRPSSEEGDYWRRSWLHAVPTSRVPKLSELKLYGGSDYAVTAGGGDYTVHAVVGLDEDDRPWLMDLWRERTSSDEWVIAWCELVKWYRPLQWAEERGQIISGVGPFLEREANERKAYTERVPFVSRADKGVRAQSMRGLVASKGLWYPADLPYRREMEAELLAFPNGKHDDFHDALGMVGQLLDMAIRGKRPEKPKPQVVTGYRTVGSQGRGGGNVHTL